MALIAIDELVGPALFRIGLARDRRNRCSGQASADRRVEPGTVPSQLRRAGAASRSTPATGGVAVALDALMRERDGVWIAHGDGTADRAVVDDQRQGARARPSARRISCVVCGFDRSSSGGYYGGFANEGLWPLCHQVDVRPQFRSEDWAAYQEVNARFAAAIDEELSAHPAGYAGVHPGLSPRARRRAAARAASVGADRAVLAHSVAVSRSPAHLSVAPRDSRRACWPTICSRSSSSAIAAISCWRSKRSSMPRIEFDDQTNLVRRPHHHGDRGANRRRLRSHPGSRRRSGARSASRRVCGRLFGLEAGLIGLGVDRLDYTKGIPERLEALEPGLHPPPGVARPDDVRADWRPVAVESDQLQRDRGRDRSARSPT